MRTTQYKNSDQDSYCLINPSSTTNYMTEKSYSSTENSNKLKMNNQIFRSSNNSPYNDKKDDSKAKMSKNIANKENWQSQAAQIENQLIDKITKEKNQCSQLSNIKKELEMRLNSIKLNELNENIDYQRPKFSSTYQSSNKVSPRCPYDIPQRDQSKPMARQNQKTETNSIIPGRVFTFVSHDHTNEKNQPVMTNQQLHTKTSNTIGQKTDLKGSFLSIVSDTNQKQEIFYDLSGIESKRRYCINAQPLSTTNSVRPDSTKFFSNESNLRSQMIEMEKNHNSQVDQLQKQILRLTKELNAANINSTTATINSFKQFELNNNAKLMLDREKKRNEELENKISELEKDYKNLRIEYEMSLKQKENNQMQLDMLKKTVEKKAEGMTMQISASESQRRELETMVNLLKEQKRKLDAKLNFEIEQKTQLKGQIHELEAHYRQEISETKTHAEIKSKMAFQSEMTKLNLNSEKTRVLYDQLETNYKNLLKENQQLKNFLTEKERDFHHNQQKIKEMDSIVNENNLYQMENQRLTGIVEDLEQEKQKLIREQFEVREIQEKEILVLQNNIKNEAHEKVSFQKTIEQLTNRLNSNANTQHEISQLENCIRELRAQISEKEQGREKSEEDLKNEKARNEKTLQRLLLYGGEVERLHGVIGKLQGDMDKKDTELEQNEKTILKLKNVYLELENKMQSNENEKLNPNSIYNNQYSDLQNECSRNANLLAAQNQEIQFLKHSLVNLEKSPAIIAELEKRLRNCMSENQRLNNLIFQRCQNMVATTGGW